MTGDSLTFVAIPLLVLHATGSVAQMGLLTALTSVGSITAGLFAGIVVDRVNRRRLMIVCDLARVVLYGLIPILWLLAPQVWLLYLVVPIGAVFGMTFHVTYVTAVPNLVDRSQIAQANGRLEATYAVATVGGVTLAGVLSAAYGPVTAIAIDAATFGISAIGLLLIRWVDRPDLDHPAATGAVSRSEFLAGMRFLWQRPQLRALTILLSAQTFITLGLVDIFVFHLKHDLGQRDTVVGYVLAIATVGSIAAGGLITIARRALSFGVIWIGSYTVCGVAIALVGWATNAFLVAGVAVVFMFCTSLAGISSMSLRQEITPDRLLGRVTSAFWTIHTSVGPIGAAVLTAAVGRFSVASVCLVAGVACALIALSGSFSALGRAGPDPTDPTLYLPEPLAAN